MRYFEFLNVLDIIKNPLTEQEAGLIADAIALSTKPFSSPFKILLEKIRQQNSVKQVNCFISYAWAAQDICPTELWTQEFIYRLAEWLHRAGINVFIDRENSRFGNQMKPFMEKHVSEDDYIILLGTKTLKIKLSSSQIFYNVSVEYEQIKMRLAKETKNKTKASVIPIIISGKNKESLPDELFGKIAIEDFSGNGLLLGQANIFLNHLQGLIAKLYGLQDVSSDLTKNYHKLWKNFQQENIFKKGNQIGNLNTNPYLYLQQTKVRQENFGKNKYSFFSLSSQDANISHIGNIDSLKSIVASITKMPAPIVTQVTVISGLGGMGKTHLAKQAMLDTKHVCKFSLWIDVESQMKTNLYGKEIEKLGFTTGNVPYTQQLQLLFDWLGDRPGWLLILDDVNNCQDIKSYIPPNGGHVIITSRHNEWPITDYHHRLDKLSNSESEELIKKYMGNRMLTIDEMHTIALRLDHLPLALIQASTYLSKNASITIDYYLKCYEQQPMEFLKQYTEHKNVWKTLSISLEKMEDQSTALLRKCVIFGHMPLPLHLLAKWIGCSKVELNTLLSTPLSYYLIQSHVEKNTVILHPIVSDILFAKLETYYKKTKIEEGLSFISEQLITGKTQYQSILISYFLEIIPKIKILDKRNIFIDSNILANTLLSVMPILLNKDNIEPMINIEQQYLKLIKNEIILKNSLLYYQLLEKLLSFYVKKRDRQSFELIREKYNSLDSAQLSQKVKTKILVSKGVIAIECNDFINAILYLEEAIKNNILSPYEQARTYANCCTAYIAIKKNEKAIEMAKQGLEILSKILSDDHVVTLRTYIKANLAEMYINDNKLEEAEKLRNENIIELERIYSINSSRGKSWDYYSLAKIACRKGNNGLAKERYGIFVTEMNKIFGSTHKWPTAYKTVAEDLNNEIEGKNNLTISKK